MTSMRNLGTGALLAVLLAAGATAPVEAQKKDKAKGNGKAARAVDTRGVRHDARPELIRRDADRWEIGQRQDGRGQAKSGAPAFCRSGEGHPVHGRRWCIDKGFGLGNASVRNDGRIYDRRGDDVYDRRGRTFEERRDIFLRDLDHRCRLRAAERPLDPAWQLRVRAECRAERERWLDRNDPARRS